MSSMETQRKVGQHDNDILALYELVDRVDGKVDKLDTKVDKLAQDVNRRFGELDTKIGELDTKIGDVDTKLDAILGHLGGNGSAS